MAKNDRANFGSKLGVILASAGSAVGLGNIWRFPYETGNHGGAAFILIYLGCIFLLGLPIMIAEFLIGRRSRANTARAYQKLAPGTHWRWVGRMGVLAGFLILSYYAVVAGWTLEYIFEAATNGFAGKTSGEFISSFQQFSSSPWRPVVWLVAFLLITHFIIVKGVEKGIEKSSKIMMPTLFISRGEPYSGQVAVGAVILNRVEHPSFPNTVAGVVYQPGAFTCMVDGQIDQPVADSAVRAAREALNGADPSGGAIYYFNPSTATSAWIWSRPLIKVIGNHRFCS